MKRKSTLLFAVITLMAVSCGKEKPVTDSGNSPEPDTNPVSITLSATIESVSSEGTAIPCNWTEDAEMTVFEENGTAVLFAASGKGNAEMTFAKEGYEGVPVYAAYPASDNLTCVSNVLGGIAIKTVQTISSAGTWCSDAVAYVGKASGNSPAYDLYMKHVTGFLKVTLMEPYVKSIKISSVASESLAGVADVDYAKLESGDGNFYTVASEGSSSVTLVPEASSDASSDSGCFLPGSYYVSLLPKTYASGLKITITFDDGTSVDNVYGEEGITIARGAVTAIDAFLDDVLPDTLVMRLNFWNMEDSWPFNEDPVEAELQSAGGESYTYSFGYERGGLPFTKDFEFVVSQGEAAAVYYYRVLNGFTYKMFCTDAADNAWIRLPAVPGRYLKAVSVSHMNMGKKRFRIQENLSADASAAGKTYSSPLAESDGWTPVQTAVIFPYEEASAMGNLIETAPGVSYYMMFTSGTSLRMTELRVVYTKTLDDGTLLPEFEDESPEVPVSASEGEKFGNISNYGDETENKGWN